MSIRAKIVMIVLPLIITPLIFTGVVSSMSARNGITAIATQFLQFKSEQVSAYAQGQWSLLLENQLESHPAFLEAAKSAVEAFAFNVVRSETEVIFALSSDGALAMQAPSRALDGAVVPRERAAGWTAFQIGRTPYVAYASDFDPFGWRIFVAEERDAFYETTNQIIRTTVLILVAAMAAAVALLMVFVGLITAPLRTVVAAMGNIISTNDLSKRVDVVYRDEIGKLGRTFNIMISELQSAYDSIKGYALRAAIAQSKEQKIRNIFQKYVPKAVIEQFFANPESMLVGENRILSVLFSDIRSFAEISERMRPDEMVESLNRYFSLMVDVVMRRGGIVDKFIGDSIMAVFGAPVRRENEAQESVLAGLDMLDVLQEFNAWQRRHGRPEFRIGIGINYGGVTVGNIGSEKKMEYTVIGDMVNLANRLEGLSKVYGEPLIVSESVQRRIVDSLPYRLLDRVVVKGRTAGVGVFAIRRRLSDEEQQAWELHRQGMEHYFARRFEDALEWFVRISAVLPQDLPSRILAQRCRQLIHHPPSEAWTGVVEMMTK